MKAVISILRSWSIRLIIYLDDILIMGSTQSEVKAHLQKAIALLEKLGFCINWKKSVVEPSQFIEFLGLVVNSESLTLSVPQHKVQKIFRECQSLWNKAMASERDLAHLIGLLTSVNQAVSVGPLHYRA
uniref:Reverse transcriptase domain-containing protein n=1 Tax=Amphimedon queenslandica TaxID=400682 RepID=A0A1X7TMA5_AMPQE